MSPGRAGYEIVSLDQLGRYPDWRNHEAPVLMPLRQELGLRAFGANCWTAEPGKQIVPRHTEESGDEELYVVVRGRARFTVDDQTLDASAGTLIHVSPGETREAIAEEADTIVLAVGATPGEAFSARGWDEVVVAFAKSRAGDLEGGRATMEALIARDPDSWEGAYNLACFEAQFGVRAEAFEQLRRALADGPDGVAEFARDDGDLTPLHGDLRWQELLG